MPSPWVGIVVIVLGCTLAGTAQTGVGFGSATTETRDGGIRETLESIFIPPKPNAPFSLVLATEWSKPMLTGGTMTTTNQRRIMRDSAGRIYQERWLLVPKGGNIKSTMNWIQISDPGAHVQYNCSPEAKKCFLLKYGGSTERTYLPGTQPSGPLSNGMGSSLHEGLGTSDVAGMPVEGTRETTTVNPGVAGNDRPMITVREFWYSATLGFNLKSQLESPFAGRETFTVTEINSQEPDASFFALPAGYEVVDRRATSPTEQ